MICLKYFTTNLTPNLIGLVQSNQRKKQSHPNLRRSFYRPVFLSIEFYPEPQSIILDFKSKNGPVIKNNAAKPSSKSAHPGKKVPPEFIRPVSSPEFIVMPDLDQPDNAKTPESLDEREAVITEDITRNLVNHIWLK